MAGGSGSAVILICLNSQEWEKGDSNSLESQLNSLLRPIGYLIRNILNRTHMIDHT